MKPNDSGKRMEGLASASRLYGLWEKVMKFTRKLDILVVATAILTGGSAMAMDEITVAYFLEWPMPFQYAKVNGTYDEELGIKVNWRSFDTGTAMSAAMASGDIQISVGQGVPPFVVAASAGQDIQIVGVAVFHSENDNCVVQANLEIDADSAKELEGKKVAVPIGTAAHYDFLRQMTHFGVDIGTMDIVDMPPAEGAAALSQGSVDMACGWGGGLHRMLENGNVLLTGAEKEELGMLVFDVTSAPANFVAEHGDTLAKFLKVTADVNKRWNAGGEMADEMVADIAKDAGMDETAVVTTMATLKFPSLDEQLSGRWLKGGAQSFMKGVANVFRNAGSIEAVLESYESAIDTGPLEAAASM